jgi:hypothetical protein
VKAPILSKSFQWIPAAYHLTPDGRLEFWVRQQERIKRMQQTNVKPLRERKHG